MFPENFKLSHAALYFFVRAFLIITSFKLMEEKPLYKATQKERRIILWACLIPIWGEFVFCCFTIVGVFIWLDNFANIVINIGRLKNWRRR